MTTYIDEDRQHSVRSDRHELLTGFIAGLISQSTRVTPIIEPDGAVAAAFVVHTEFGDVTVAVGEPHP